MCGSTGDKWMPRRRCDGCRRQPPTAKPGGLGGDYTSTSTGREEGAITARPRCHMTSCARRSFPKYLSAQLLEEGRPKSSAGARAGATGQDASRQQLFHSKIDKKHCTIAAESLPASWCIALGLTKSLFPLIHCGSVMYKAVNFFSFQRIAPRP